jgi:hypothetical protein
MVKTLLKRYKYPLDRQEEATDTVLSQAKNAIGGLGGSVVTCPCSNLSKF